jgi:hypothetical protein
MTTNTDHISFRDTRSATVRQYGTRFALFTPEDDTNYAAERHFRGSARRHINMGGDQQLNSSGFQAAQGLFAIDGISSVTMRPLEANVSRFLAFDWDDLHEDIMRVMHSADPYCMLLPHLAAPSPIRRIRLFRTRSDQVFHYALTARLFTPLHNLDAEHHLPSTSAFHQPVFTPLGSQAIKAVRRVPGVTSVTIRPFEVNVFKYDHFSFEEMHDGVLDSLRLAFPGDEIVVVEKCGLDYPY